MNIKLTRRQFLKTTAIAGAGMALPLKFWKGNAYAFYQSPGLQKWQPPLRGVGPGQIPVVGLDGFASPVTGVAHATINVQQFTDKLHPALGPTKLWGFHPANPLGARQPQKHLGGIIVVKKGEPLQLTFRNNASLPRQSSPSTRRSPAQTRPRTAQLSISTAVSSPGSATAAPSTGGPRTAPMD